jgi:hypothetical protein
MAATTTTAVSRSATGVATTTAAPASARMSDDEILGIEPARVVRRGAAVSDATGFGGDDGGDAARLDDVIGDAADGERDAGADDELLGDDARLRQIADANPELRGALRDVAEYKELFETPAAARQARELVADVNRLDALFFSRRPEDHAELAKLVAGLDRDAFAMLAKSMTDLVEQDTGARAVRLPADGAKPSAAPSPVNAAANSSAKTDAGAMSAAQREFMQGANAAAVESVVNEIETQVGKLLPEGITKPAKNRVVGEIYRELDGMLRANRALTQQIHDAFRVGRLDTDHQRALVALITARAKQALPGVAKRVLNEWTSAVVTTNQERRERQRNAERRVDISGTGTGGGGRKPITSRDIDYRRMSDGDILNL